MEVRHNWTVEQVRTLMDKPFMDLIFEAQQVHRHYQQHNHVQVSTLLSIKTGACPEDCKYCPQSARYTTDIEKERLMEVERVLDAAQKAKKAGSTRFCMGAAWKNPKQRDMPYLTDMTLVEQIVKSRCKFGSTEAAEAFASIDAKEEKLKKRRDVLQDAMELEGLDVLEEEEGKGDSMDADLGGENAGGKLPPLTWYEKEKEAALVAGGGGEPQAKKARVE